MLDPAKVRTWTDRSGSFKVDAEFILIKDGKIHLHKVNGVKIAVPVTKMSVEDLGNPLAASPEPRPRGGAVQGVRVSP